MSSPRLHRSWASHASGAALIVLLLGSVHACWPGEVELNGSCAVASTATVDCRAAGYSGELQDAGLVGYVCSGTERPDLDATYVEGVPQGLVCSDQPVVGGDAGTRGYCCTAEPQPCAYDPAVVCEAPSYGVQCRGNNRPESLNPTIHCSNGFFSADHELVNYCCSGTDLPPACTQQDSLGCSTRQLGFLCEGDSLPRGEQLGANKSRADFFHPLCTIPQVAPNPKYKSYCCYMPALVPIGGTCVQHTSVPGCAPGRFGFACYGPDTPEDDYLPMTCPEPGFEGLSDEGYPATLYCCDFEE